jgi:GH43 family beta-xylosidase
VHYYAYGTGDSAGAGADGVFEILRSPDLVHWTALGTALTPPPEARTDAHWAPEVAAAGGKFHLYYSRAPHGRDEEHRIRVAVADHPAGPFIDAGPVLPDALGFCIDAHPFRDPRDGAWYLFFAKDYFDERTGTGLAVARLSANLLSIEGPVHDMLRANADWQIYERNRTHYRRQWRAWHTVEGPCVVAHGGRYYCFYSGGNWQTRDYGVSYAVANHPFGPWAHAAQAGPIVLRERPDEVLGPGHNSYAVTPDNIEVLVYHAWDPDRERRRMCLDRLVWTDEGPRCLGPTNTTQEL